MAIATTTHPFVGILKEPVKQQTVTQGVYKDRVLVPVLMGLLIRTGYLYRSSWAF
jgi:hypothetical protein